jgi:hypothetical protein
MRNTQKHSVGRMGNLLISNLMVHIITAGFKILKSIVIYI